MFARPPCFDKVYVGFGHGYIELAPEGATGATLAAMTTEEARSVDTVPDHINRPY